MKLQDVGLSKDDLLKIMTVCAAQAETYLDENGAPPPKTTGSPPLANQDYIDWIDYSHIAQVAAIFRSQVVDYDTANTSDTDPAATLCGQAGGY